MTTLRMPTGSARPVRVPLEDVALNGDFQVPKDPIGLVIFVHGSGSSRFSPRNRYVAGELNKHEETMELRFDIPLLSSRSTLVARWAGKDPDLRNLPIGLFGASTGAAAALNTAAALKEEISAVVSRGGRPDLAEAALPQVKAPTLLIVGGEDDTVLELNRKALERLRCNKRLHVVPGATHLFEERGTLEEVASVAANWFREHLGAAIGARERRAG
jgi:putative phosphoribosyl transferase